MVKITKQLEKLIAAWNEDVMQDERDSYSEPQYKGLSLSFNAREWREDHPQAFPAFAKLRKERYVSILRRYDIGNWYLPSSIIQMLLEGEVTYGDLEVFITMLLEEKDKKDQRVILSP